ncbi:MAG: hypothetical protein IPI73_24320 [Betaproteobacteria bacterium]|nr:hypothetical protein [Betaproteobacteria bacterium]
MLDIDGNNQADALTDSLLIIRYLFNLRGDGLIRDAVGTGAIRTTAEQIEARIQGLLAVPPIYTLTVGKTGTGTGTVTSSPAGIDCGSDCTEDYSAGTLIQLTATPDAGSTFGGWGGACAGTGPCTLTLSGNTLVTAVMTANPGALPTIPSFSADPATIGPGGNSTLAWSITDATLAAIDHGVGSVNAAGGSTGVSPGMTTTYTLTATNASGTRQAQATVKVNPVAAPVINSFTATPGSIGAGGSSTLSWSIANATSAAIDNGIGSVSAVSGSTGASPIATTTYTLMAANAGGTTFARATIANTAGAPPFNPTVATSVATSIAFLYSGPSPVQTGVAPGTIEVRRAAVVRGKVSDRARHAVVRRDHHDSRPSRVRPDPKSRRWHVRHGHQWGGVADGQLPESQLSARTAPALCAMARLRGSRRRHSSRWIRRCRRWTSVRVRWRMRVPAS